MSKLKPHPQADLIKAWTDGNTIQMRHIDKSEWEDTAEPRFSLTNQYDYRIKPRTILINGIEVPEPVREPLEDGQKYWTFITGWRDDVYQSEWEGSDSDYNFLNQGLVHLTREATEIYARAILSFTKIKDE